MITVRRYFPSADYDFVRESIENDFKLNREKDPLHLIAHDIGLKADQVFIVHRGNKDLGFFINQPSAYKFNVNFMCWTHPRACKMSMVHLVKVAAIRATLYAIENSYENISSTVWHPLITRTVRKVIPEMTEEKIEDDYRILSVTVKDILATSTLNSGRGAFRNVYGYDYDEFDKEHLTFTLREEF